MGLFITLGFAFDAIHGGGVETMLVLSRKAGQELVIGENIRITVNRVGGNRVTLGIHAPDEVRVMRGELDPIEITLEEAVGTVERVIGK